MVIHIHVAVVGSGIVFHFILNELETWESDAIKRLMVCTACIADGYRCCTKVLEGIKPGTENTPDDVTAKALTAKAAELGLILLSCGVYGNSIRVLVPITVEDAILDEAMAILEAALRAVRA